MSELIPVEVVKHVTHPIIKLLQSQFGLWVVGFVSFIESALPVPIITDPFMMAYILINRHRTFWAVFVTLVTSVAGGVTAYLMAFYSSDLVLSYLSPTSLEYFASLAEQAQAEIFVLTILGAITPIPYTLVGLAGGFVKGNLLVFVLASVLGRGLRYVVVGYLTYKFGIQAIEHIKQHLKWITIVTILFAVGYFLSRFLG